MEILRDSVWQFIGALVAVVGIIAAVWIYWLQKHRKGLSYEILASNELLTASEEIRGRIEVLFDKMPVQNIHLVVVRFINDGNVPILATDFYQPLKITFGQETEILSVEIIGRSPDSFNPEIDWEASPTMVPTLMNSQDSFTIKLLLAQYTGELKISGRIVGVKAVTKNVGGQYWSRIKLWSYVFILLALPLAFIPSAIQTILFTIVFVGVIVSGIAEIASSPPYKSKKN